MKSDASKDSSKAVVKTRQRERLAHMLNSGVHLSAEDGKLAASLLQEHKEQMKRQVDSEAKHVAVLYYDYLRRLALAKLGKKRLSPEQKRHVAEDAITLTEARYPSCRGKIDVYAMIGIDGGNGLVDQERVDSMREHFEQIALVRRSDLARDEYTLPDQRRALYR